jgi:hypothetical protein
MTIEIADLLGLIDGLDEINPDDYLSLSRFNAQGAGETDARMTAVVRQLARERLSMFPTEEIGMEALRLIDKRRSGPAA